MKLFLIRHGQTDWNIKGKIQGSCDIELNDTGIIHAEELSNKLTGIAFGQVLPEAKNFAYVGGPNATVEMGQKNGLVIGEMWIPVVRK